MAVQMTLGSRERPQKKNPEKDEAREGKETGIESWLSSLSGNLSILYRELFV